MERKIIQTGDGSKTILIPEWGEQYHSIHGALAEARHVFIEHGLLTIPEQQFAILEMGFGTGLNAFLTFLKNASLAKEIHYTALEAYPLEKEMVQELNYMNVIQSTEEAVFDQMHAAPWGEKIALSEKFYLHKIAEKLEEITFFEKYDLVYYDAFSPRVHPNLWTEAIFEKLYANMNEKGVLVTYCAKGSVKRALKSVGFLVESLTGPPGKREMTRAKKI